MKKYKNMNTKNFSAIPFVVTPVTASKTNFKKVSISSFLLIVIIQFSLNVSILNSQAVELISPTIYGIKNLTDIEKSGNKIFVSGDEGLLLTLDLVSNSVEKIELDIDNAMIQDITFNSQGNGVAICTKGIVLFSSNNGQNWSKKLVDSTDFLTSVNYISEEFVIITAMNGTIYKSMDSGKNWDRVTLNTVINLRASIEINGSLILCGDNGLIAKSTDNGNTWSISSKSYLGNILSINTVGNTLIIGANDGIYYSEDAGNTWVRSIQQEGVRAKNLITFGSRTYATSDSGNIFVSVDEGKNWVFKSSSDITINGMLMLSEDSWLTIGDYTKLEVTMDGGKNYSDILSNTNRNFVSANYLSDGSAFILSTAGEANSLATDELSHLSKLPSGFYRTSQTVGDEIYVLDETGIIYISSDNGLTWELKAQIEDNQIYNDFFIVDDIIFATSTKGDVLKYDKNEWTTVKVLDSLNLTTIRFFDINNGFVCGSLGKIYFTTNSGSSWTAASTPSTSMITDGVVLNSDVAFISSYKGYFFNTTDRGETWMKTSDDSVNDRILSIDIHQDMLLGIAGTASGKLLYTNDAFRTWNSIYDIGHLLVDVAINGNNVIAIGPYSIVLTVDLLQSSVEDFTYDNTISVYPNPSNGQFHLSITNNELLNEKALTNPVIEIVDINGKLVYENMTPEFNENNSILIDLGQMISGVYLLTIKSSTKTYSKRLLLNK